MRRALWLFIITIVGLCVHAGAQPQLSVDVGWESRYRSGRWTPIYITLSDSAPREVMLEVQAPYDRRYQIFIRQGLTISPTPITVPIYIPLNQSLQETQITLRSASGRRLASMPLEEDPMASAINRTTGILPVDPAGLFIGVSGAMATEKMLATQLSSDRVTVAYLPPQRLPAVPVGYEGIDVLMLNAPDVNRIAIDQQEAIMQWVRAGGNLVMWPGPEPVPVTSPIVDALPVRIGENQNYEFDVKALRSAGLPDRFAKLKGRALTTMPSSVKVNLLSQPEAAGYRARVGYGQILVLPIDASLLRFDTNAKAEAFWVKVLTGVADVPVPPKEGETVNRYWQYNNALSGREQAAMAQTLNWMGSIPGAGTFGFSYIAAVLIVMMLIVGPVDWIVLKMMGRQPWTWVTTAGWAGLITVAAIFIGHVFKSGELHFRTTSIIDESDGARVAATDVAAIYSPRTADYELKCDPEGWWKPASEFIGWSNGGPGLKVDIPCHQDYNGNRPLPLRVNVWNLRFLTGTTHATAPGTISAKLEQKYDEKLKKRVLAGTVTNHAKVELTDVIVRMAEGTVKVREKLAPGETVEISSPIDVRDATFKVADNEQAPIYSSWQQGPNVPQEPPTTAKMADLAMMRSERVEKLLTQYRDTACVYARCSAAPETVKLALPEAKRVHEQVIRSLVHLERPPAFKVRVISATRAATRSSK